MQVSTRKCPTHQLSRGAAIDAALGNIPGHVRAKPGDRPEGVFRSAEWRLFGSSRSYQRRNSASRNQIRPYSLNQYSGYTRRLRRSASR